MDDRYEQTTSEGYVVDTVTYAVINTNEKEYLKVLERRQQAKKIIQLQLEVNDIKTDIKDIKDLLLKALSGR
jgi:hypothetical protein